MTVSSDIYSLYAISLVEKPWEMSSRISLSLAVTGLSILIEEQTVFKTSKLILPPPPAHAGEAAV